MTGTGSPRKFKLRSSDPAVVPACCQTTTRDTRLLKRVQEIMDLESLFRIGGISFHTAFLSTTSDSAVEKRATDLLRQMSQIGQGTFRNFRNGGEINFLHVGFTSLRRVFRLKSFVASNQNARPTENLPITDSDGDGIPDEREALAGMFPTRIDSDGDGFSDSLEHFFRASGSDPLDPTDADCPIVANDADGNGIPDDLDGDGLFDCEERFLGTSKFRFDSDADGMPDGLEVRFGTNAAANDVLKDNLDFDGMPNGDELRLHTGPDIDDAAHRSRNSLSLHHYPHRNRARTSSPDMSGQCGMFFGFLCREPLCVHGRSRLQ